jgi:hypothetical protein
LPLRAICGKTINRPRKGAFFIKAENLLKKAIFYKNVIKFILFCKKIIYLIDEGFIFPKSEVFMKKRHFYLVLLALSAFLAFFVACGTGNPESIMDDITAWGNIQNSKDYFVDQIKHCYDAPTDKGCPIIDYSSSSAAPPPPPDESSSSEGGTPPGPSSNSGGTSSAGGVSSAGGNSSSAGGVSSSSAGTSSAASSSSAAVTYTLECTGLASAGTVGTAIPAPTVTCKPSTGQSQAVTSGLSWTPSNLTPTTTGSVAVSVSVSGGNCGGKNASCGNVTVAAAAQPSSSSQGNTGGSTSITLPQSATTLAPGTYNVTASACSGWGNLIKCSNNTGTNCSITINGTDYNNNSCNGWCTLVSSMPATPFTMIVNSESKLGCGN